MSIDFTLLPNFFIIGAAKSGTTSLFNTLEQHPDIYGSQVKEIGFFNNDERFALGLDWYQNNYFSTAAGCRVRMEASPAYLTWSEKVAPRIQKSYQEHPIKFAVIFRDPVERAYSHYWHRVRLGHEELSFPEAIAREEERLKNNWDALYRAGDGKFGYFRAGCYVTRLRPYLDVFPKEQFIFLLQEDLSRARFTSTSMNVLHFLGVSETISLSPDRSNVATKERARSVTKLYWTLKKTFLKAFYRANVPSPVRKRIHNFLFPPSEYPAMDEEIALSLRMRYVDEIRKLEEIIGRDLSSWRPH